MKRISVKLGIVLSALFLAFVIVIGCVMYVFMVQFYLKQVTNELLHRGHSHAMVLAQNFDAQTMHHVALMEGPAITSVVVLDNQGNILVHSDPIDPLQKPYLVPIKGHPTSMYEEIPIETDWENKPFIATRSPIIKGKQLLGTVVMFSPTNEIRQAVDFLKYAVVTFSVGTVLFGLLLIFYLSIRITRPLIQMKEATQKIAKGDYSLVLSMERKDELGDLAASIRFLAKSLQHYEQTRNEFLADVSHELRTPLTYLKGYSEILLQGRIQDEGEQKDYLKIIHDESIRVHHLVQDLFDLSKLEAGSVSLELCQVDLVEIIRSITERLRPAFKTNQIDLTLNIRTPSAMIHGDPKRLEQVFLNLLDNAKRYTPAKGKVEIVVNNQEKDVIVHVIDNGIGISQSELPLIWKRLYRVEKSRSRETGGSGLGLSIVKKIVDLHQGSIEVTSVEYQGTTFSLTFPLINSNFALKRDSTT